jgi:hypothetical protein
MMQAIIEPITKIDLMNLTSGIYIIRLATTKGIKTQIIVKK